MTQDRPALTGLTLNPPPPMYYVCASFFFFFFFPRPPTLFPFFMLSQSIDAECCICVLILSSYPACTRLYPSFSLLSPLLLPALYLCFKMLVPKGRIYIKFENRFVCALHTENKELASNSRQHSRPPPCRKLENPLPSNGWKVYAFHVRFAFLLREGADVGTSAANFVLILQE